MRPRVGVGRVRKSGEFQSVLTFGDEPPFLPIASSAIKTLFSLFHIYFSDRLALAQAEFLG